MAASLGAVGPKFLTETEVVMSSKIVEKYRNSRGDLQSVSPLFRVR